MIIQYNGFQNVIWKILKLIYASLKTQQNVRFLIIFNIFGPKTWLIFIYVYWILYIWRVFDGQCTW